MKLTLSILVYLIIGWVIGTGILDLMHGHYLWLGVSAVVYVVLFAWIGCAHH